MAFMVTRRATALAALAVVLQACGGGEEASTALPRDAGVPVRSGYVTYDQNGSTKRCEVGQTRILEVHEEDRTVTVSRYIIFIYGPTLVAADRRFPDRCSVGTRGSLNVDLRRFRGTDLATLGEYRRLETSCEAGGDCGDLGEFNQRGNDLAAELLGDAISGGSSDS